jgi:circadian clock protein KaiA
LIRLPDIQKYLHNPSVKGQPEYLIWLIWQIKNFLTDVCYHLFSIPLAVTTPLKISYLHYGKLVNNNLLLTDNNQSVHILACNEQKNQQWFQEMSTAQKQEILEDLKSDYRQILLNYFISEKNLKTTIDKFINTLFYANIPVPQIIEIHMELIDEFSKQLKLEGRSDETLLDYRLTLIDILAHLCEVYRCATSKKN